MTTQEMYTIHTFATRKDGSVFENSCRFLALNASSLQPCVDNAEAWETKTVVEVRQESDYYVAETPNGTFNLPVATIPPFDGGKKGDISYTNDFEKV